MNNHLDNEIAAAGAQLSSLQSKHASANGSAGGNAAANNSHGHFDHNSNFHGMMPRRESIGVVNVLGDALFGRRTSLGFGGDLGSDMGFGGDRMLRRGSMDSVVDAAIQNLTNRRLSMMGSSTQATMNGNSMNNSMGGGMPVPSLSASMMGGGLGMMGKQSQSMNGMNGPKGMNINSNGKIGMSSQINQFLMNGLGLNSMIANHNMNNSNNSNNNNDGNGVSNSNLGANSNMDGNISMRQRQLQEQRLELQRRQKELELQRQQLLNAMEERKQAMQQMQETIQRGAMQQRQQADRRHSLFGGALSTMPLTDHDTAALLAERRGSFGGGVDANRVKLENEWRRTNGMRDERRGSLDLLGAIAGVTQEAEAHNSMMNKAGKSDLSPMNPNSGILRTQSNSSAHGLMSNAQTRTFSVIEKPIPLGLPADKDWLTPLHCFVRIHCVEVFTATKADVAIPTKGKRKPIQIGQVGIRCPHCHNSESGALSRERGSVYYPTRYVYSFSEECKILVMK